MAKLKKDAKKHVLPHSQAKLDLYSNYLEHYLRVLGLASFCSRINLYDLFCGAGIYDDGNIGSPVIARNCIKDLHALLDTLEKPVKPLTLTVNDREKDKIVKVRQILEEESLRECRIRYFSEDADDMLEIVSKEVNTFPSTERNLVFIDPYGYSNVDKEKIHTILKNKHTEVIIFLPVMQMYRFIGTALTSSDVCYEDLRKFMFSFFPEKHRIREDGMQNIFEFINEIKEALSFEGEFYTSSHYLEREKGNYYALFFISSSIYGLEKMLEAKWRMDPIKGKGFNQKKPQMSIFQGEFDEIDKRQELDFLANKILQHIDEKGSLNNNDIYELSVLNEFRPTHANAVIKQLLKQKIKAKHPSGGKSSGGAGFGINYNNYKNKEPKIIFEKR